MARRCGELCGNASQQGRCRSHPGELFSQGLRRGNVAKDSGDFDVSGLPSIGQQGSGTGLLLVVTVPLYDSGLREARVKDAESRAEMAEVEFHRLPGAFHASRLGSIMSSSKGSICREKRTSIIKGATILCRSIVLEEAVGWPPGGASRKVFSKVKADRRPGESTQPLERRGGIVVLLQRVITQPGAAQGMHRRSWRPSPCR